MRVVESRAPGRVNIIGEHTDYNDGFVLPCAIAYDTRVLASERPDRVVMIRSHFEEPQVFDLDRLPAHRMNCWADYARGILYELGAMGARLHGCDLDVSGTVPIGVGLSSSASFEIALALALLAIAQVPVRRSDLARLAQRAESEYAGTRCGIMDQFAVLYAREGHAMFLDTRTLEFRHVAFPDGAALVICNTMVKHELASSAYNERRGECERAVQLLRAQLPDIRALGDVSVQALQDAKSLLPPTIFRRARHVVTENARVAQTVDAFERVDLQRAGELMYQSHESLRYDYQVSCAELDAMVDLARRFEGTLGARMTGGGFGGCTVNLVRRVSAGAFAAYIANAYRAETGIVPEIYDGTPSAAASATHE